MQRSTAAFAMFLLLVDGFLQRDHGPPSHVESESHAEPNIKATTPRGFCWSAAAALPEWLPSNGGSIPSFFSHRVGDCLDAPSPSSCFALSLLCAAS